MAGVAWSGIRRDPRGHDLGTTLSFDDYSVWARQADQFLANGAKVISEFVDDFTVSMISGTVVTGQSPIDLSFGSAFFGIGLSIAGVRWRPPDEEKVLGL